MIPLSWKFRLLPGHFWLLVLLSQQTKKRVIVLGGVIEPNYQKKSQYRTSPRVPASIVICDMF
jgi:hypothetical protein